MFKYLGNDTVTPFSNVLKKLYRARKQLFWGIFMINPNKKLVAVTQKKIKHNSVL